MTSYRQKIQEILSSKKRFFGPVTTGTCEDESLSVGSESGLIFEDFTLVLPQEDKLAKFEADLIVDIQSFLSNLSF